MENNDTEKAKKISKKKSRLSSKIEEIENSPSPITKKIKRFNQEDNIENFLNFNLELFSDKNDEDNKENISDNILNIALRGKANLNIASKIKEECNKNDNDFNKEEEYGMLKQNFDYKVKIFFKNITLI